MPELRFWACFAVVFALLSQALFPMQAMALSGNTSFVLCTEGGAPAADTVSQKLFGKAKPGFMGLKCANCVLASITALPVPAPVSTPIAYTSERIAFQAAKPASPVRARAPPRPFSCGPPETVAA
ncbi:hypothetical protein [Asticcacaulis solisilvae]|uniref:hypothetical protein n=1 Tax=Asticcacaulis solisilvae TaxID=1217274 RepID=UPI003FD8D9DC